MSTVNIGIVGFGFMGRTHLAAYQAARAAGFDCRVVAIADGRFATEAATLSTVAPAGNFDTGAARAELFDRSEVSTHADAAAIFADPKIHLVSVCTPTDTHVAMASAALAAGKHVLCEKPVALDARDIETLAGAARAAGKLCMPAMCMRFWPGWSWLKERVVDGSLGAIRSATFQRLGSPPDWGMEFYRDMTRTGGPLMDLHIHDADFVHWLFGGVRGVVSRGGLAHGTTLYEAAPAHDGVRPHVMSEWGQDHHPGFGFRMRFVVVFEHATADFDIGRTPTLLLHRNGASETIALPEGSGYDHEVRHLIDAIQRGRGAGELTATLEDAVEVAKLLARERASLG